MKAGIERAVTKDKKTKLQNGNQMHCGMLLLNNQIEKQRSNDMKCIRCATIDEAGKDTAIPIVVLATSLRNLTPQYENTRTGGCYQRLNANQTTTRYNKPEFRLHRLITDRRNGNSPCEIERI